MPVGKSPVQKLAGLAADFVVKQNGCWVHEDWEGFVAEAAKLGFILEDEGKRNLGNVLEALKYFYTMSPEPQAAPAKAKKKTSKS